MRTGGAVIAPLISCSASGKALAESLRRWWQGFSLPPVGLGLKSSRLGIGDIDLTGRKQKVNVTGGRVALELLSKGWYTSLEYREKRFYIESISNI